MRYEVRLLNRNLTGENKVVFRTESKKDVFGFACEVKKHENNEFVCEYDYVAVFDNDKCLVKIRLF